MKRYFVTSSDQLGAELKTYRIVMLTTTTIVIAASSVAIRYLLKMARPPTSLRNPLIARPDPSRVMKRAPVPARSAPARGQRHRRRSHPRTAGVLPPASIQRYPHADHQPRGRIPFRLPQGQR